MTEVVMRVEGLTKSYGPLTAVKNLNLDVYAGEILGFLGPNGAGKTTSINMMVGLLQPDAGQITLHGVPISGKGNDMRPGTAHSGGAGKAETARCAGD